MAQNILYRKINEKWCWSYKPEDIKDWEKYKEQNPEWYEELEWIECGKLNEDLSGRNY